MVKVLPAAEKLTAADYADVVGNLSSYESGGLHAQDAGLLTNFDPNQEAIETTKNII
ncbi:MAG: hypothetical protein JW841_12210 [Deltaproteobacteria bacterium]|nr:hypothetical protein [Deltaproteobacteria bacterium]